MHGQASARTTTAVWAIAAGVFTLHLACGNQYGFHRDELATLDDARHLAWGYVAYPPLTPLAGRIGLALFGPSPGGIRVFAALAQALAIVLTGRMAREMGGGVFAQALAAACVAASPLSLASGSLLQYVAFDYLFWVLAALMVLRLARTGDARLWIPIGAVIGIGMMNRYTMLFFASALAIAVVLTPLRSHLKSPWLWSGAAVSLLIFLPNAVWQFRHDFISLDFLRSIHARDIRLGRTDTLFRDQFYIATSAGTVPVWIAGLMFFFSKRGERFRVAGWLYVAALGIYAITRARGYYVAPAYPPLFAGGALLVESASVPWRACIAFLTAVGAIASALIAVPIAPVHSKVWNVASKLNPDFGEEIGWPELVSSIAAVWNSLPPSARAHAAILAGDYGVAGAIDLFGSPYGLPPATSGSNSFQARGYGNPPPETVIAAGFRAERLAQYFENCTVHGRSFNRFGVENEQAKHPEIFVCRGPRAPWPRLWDELRTFQ